MADQDWLDSWLELWDGTPGRSQLYHGYGWSFPMGDGTCNVGMGLPDAQRYRDVDFRDVMARWLAALPQSWGFSPKNQLARVASAALPMGFNRKPTYGQGLLLVGDAAGAINPFIGEGISYAMETGRYAADAIISARTRGFHTRSAERALQGYSARLRASLGGYFGAGNLFAKVIANPTLMKFAAHYGLPIPVVRMFTHRILGQFVNQPSRDGYDRVISAITRVVRRA
jgi:flavin-dependent dehydrogenase